MKISFNTLNGQSAEEKNNILDAMKRVLESGHYILGKEVANFENTFSKYVGVKHSVGVANGLEALQISLMALGVGPGDEVITCSQSAVATALAIKAVGAKVVFVDVDPFYHLNAIKVEEKITPNTKAIIPVHLYGQSADMDVLVKIADKHKIHIVEDCAQAHGATYENKKVGSFGTFGCFSFYPTKNLGGIGDGGLITTDSDELAEKARMIRNYGQKNRYEHQVYGINSRLDELQAAILSEQLKSLDKNNTRRSEIATLYKKELENVHGIKLPRVREYAGHIYHLFVIETDKRDELQAFLKEKGIDTLIHYPIPIHQQKCFPEYNNIHLPKTEEYAKKILSLPMHPYLKDAEVVYICESIKLFGNK